MALSFTWTSSCVVLLLVAPTCPCQLFSGFRLPSLSNPLSDLFSGPGGNPDSDVTNGRAGLKDDPLPDLVPRNGPPQLPTMYRNAFDPMGNSFGYFPRPQPSVVPAFLPQQHLQHYQPSRLPEGLHQQGGGWRIPETRVQLRRRPLVPEEVDGDISSFIRRPENNDKDFSTSSTAEDRVIAALKLFKQLRTMAL
ncbi:hypothetical protein HPB47_009155 [Ixodes persulcatus]|uniref:Uncharacterized protein n=1 Tax=Ixodes persulcatus TaxID=34615 RepID=A0AC60P307_IXOPE|nr:hypothetical protein HPB47_009155 [Ixodes persulcatus]